MSFEAKSDVKYESVLQEGSTISAPVYDSQLTHLSPSFMYMPHIPQRQWNVSSANFSS